MTKPTLEWNGSKGLYAAETPYGRCVVFQEGPKWIFVEPPSHDYGGRYTTSYDTLAEAKAHAQRWLEKKKPPEPPKSQDSGQCRWCHRRHDSDMCSLKPLPDTRYGQQRIRDRRDCPNCGGVGIACSTCYDFRGDPMG